MVGVEQMYNSYLWLKQLKITMHADWTISRRKFLTLSGTSLAGLYFTPSGYSKNGDNSQLRFGMLSDVHYAEREPAGKRFYRQSHGKVQEAIDQMNREKLDFVIELGDFKDQDAVPDETKTLQYLTKIEAVLQKFDGPTYHVLGNHDMDGISKQQFLERVENTGISKRKSYFSYNLKGLHFVVLDGNFTKDGVAYDHGNFNWEDALVSDEQLVWLKNDLKANTFPVIVFIHQMLDDSKNAKHAVKNAAVVRKVLEDSEKVLCVFQGHVHEERYNLINGIHYYSVNAVVDGDGSENSAFMIVDINRDGSLKIDGFHRATDHELKSVLR